MKNERVDLSSLAARSDARHWDDVVNATMRRVDEVLAGRSSITAIDQLVLWTRPALAVAAVIILLALPIIVAEQSTINVGPGADGMATISNWWATGGPQPSAALLETIVERSEP
jgi:hypothetical protein